MNRTAMMRRAGLSLSVAAVLALGCSDQMASPEEGLPRDAALARDEPDQAVTQPPDLHLAPPDLAVAPMPDLSPPPDLTATADLVETRDFAAPVDLAAVSDFGTPRDLTRIPDLSPPIDLAEERDLIVPPDMAMPVGQVTGSVGGVMISENCMPQVAPDPVSVTATVKFTNTGNLDVGPINVAGGYVTQMKNTIATFTILPVQTPVLAPGNTATVTITKLPNTVMPANQCMTVPCNGGVQLVVPYDGPGVPMGNKAVSALAFVTCTF